jgi:uncharacterized iron-regulated protein
MRRTAVTTLATVILPHVGRIHMSTDSDVESVRGTRHTHFRRLSQTARWVLPRRGRTTCVDGAKLRNALTSKCSKYSAGKCVKWALSLLFCALQFATASAQQATPYDDCLEERMAVISTDGKDLPPRAPSHRLANMLVTPSTLPTGLSCTLRHLDNSAQPEFERLKREHGIVLFGEFHDNPLHHRIRAGLIPRVSIPLHPRLSTKPTTLIFEHIRADQSAALAPFNTGDLTKPSRGSAADLFKALDWDNSGWPDKAMFEPLFEAALRSGAKIAHGDPMRATVRDVAKRGLAVLTADEIARLKLDQPLPPAMQEALLNELEASHCGLMPKTAFTNMAVAQRYRDAYLAAQVLAAHADGSRVILFAGNGHVRPSGVPYALSLMKPDAKVAAIQFLEVEDGKTDPRDYIDSGMAFFTPRAERKDPCEDMRKQFGKKG